MSNPSNLYAEKIYAEHPIALWSLDDKADYISLVSEAQRVLSDTTKWDVPIGGTVSNYSQSIDEPFPESQTTKITGALTDNDFGQVVCISKDIANLSTLNKELATFSVGAFFNSISSPFVKQVKANSFLGLQLNFVKFILFVNLLFNISIVLYTFFFFLNVCVCFFF